MSSLQFQDFNIGSPSESISSANTDFRPTGQIGDRAQLFDARSESEGEKGRRPNFFSFRFYQRYFDVDTDQVASRILNSMVPRFHMNFITDYVQPLPDLYGPFWVCVTLVFTTAIFGYLAKYVQTSGDLKNNEYGSDFRLVTGASTIIACYVILIPFALYSLLWYRRCEMQYSYLEILCAYGYSLSIFVPISMLWVIHAEWFRWLLILLSVMLSGSVLVGSVWPAVRSDPNKALAVGTVATVLLLHASLAIGFKEFYFDAAQSVRAGSAPVPEHPGNPPLITDAAIADKKNLLAADDGIMKGGNSSKRAASDSASGKADVAVVVKNTKAVDLAAAKASTMGMTGFGGKSGLAVIHK